MDSAVEIQPFRVSQVDSETGAVNFLLIYHARVDTVLTHVLMSMGHIKLLSFIIAYDIFIRKIQEIHCIIIEFHSAQKFNQNKARIHSRFRSRTMRALPFDSYIQETVKIGRASCRERVYTYD